MASHPSLDALITVIHRRPRGRGELEEHPGQVIAAARALAPDVREAGVALLCERVETHADSTACAALGAMGAREAIPTLQRALKHARYDRTRRNAAWALEQLGETEGVLEGLFALLEGGCIDAAIDLRRYRGPDVEAALKVGLAHADSLVRHHCAETLLIVAGLIADSDSDEFGALALWMSSGWACGRRRGWQGFELLREAKRTGASVTPFRGGYKIPRRRRTKAFTEVQEWIIEGGTPPGPEVLGQVNATERHWIMWAMLRGLEESFNADKLAVLRYLDDELAAEFEAEYAERG